MVAVLTVLIALPVRASESRGSEPATAAMIPTAAMPLASEATKRPAVSPALKALFASHAAVNALDVYSTLLAKGQGAREMNPIMDGGSARMLGIKAAGGVCTYFVVRRIAKQNRKAAIVTMLVLNGVTAAVAVNNLRNAR
jgi:hypothetical protein